MHHFNAMLLYNCDFTVLDTLDSIRDRKNLLTYAFQTKNTPQDKQLKPRFPSKCLVGFKTHQKQASHVTEDQIEVQKSILG